MADIFDLFRQIAKKEEPTGAITHMIVGLGNPGTKYQSTRHNAGFLTLDDIARRAGARIDRAKFHALCGEATLFGHRVLLLKPQTMMNASGQAVQEAAAFYKLAPESILVISDDITGNPGRMRLRLRGSAGGQKGLNDIITCMGTDAFPRLRMGVGAKPHPDYDLAAWVLSDLTGSDMEKLTGCFDDVWKGLEQLLAGKSEAAVQIINSHTPGESEA